MTECLLRVRTKWGDVVGSAFLVAPDRVATTKSVLEAALRPGIAPGATVHLDFPFLRADGKPLQTTARVEHLPGHASAPALLRLLDATSLATRMPPLRRMDHPVGRTFATLGFPARVEDAFFPEDGVWITGQIGDTPAGPGLHPSPGEPDFDDRYVGAPVWDTSTGTVLGMTGLPTTTRSAVLLPISDVIGYDPGSLPCPYPGLRPFDEEHAATFFGRADDVRRLREVLDSHPIAAVTGPSGSGKSSLVRAGLVPWLRHERGEQIVHLRPGHLGYDDIPAPDGRPTVLVFDQFEEYAARDPHGARRLLTMILRHVRWTPGVRAVLTLRWTNLDGLFTPELTAVMAGGIVAIDPLDRKQLREAVTGPARQPPGLGFEPGLVEKVLDDAGTEPGRLPLVGSLLAELWDRQHRRREGGLLTLADYTAVGGVAGALARHADELVDKQSPETQNTLRRLLIALIELDRDGNHLRRRLPVDQLPPEQQQLLPILTAGRLVTVTDDVAEIAHQALIDHWPRLGTWLDEDREFLAWRQRISTQRERWETEDRSEAALLRGPGLAGAAGWLRTRGNDLSDADLHYLHSSELSRRRTVRRWQIVAAVVSVLALAAGVLSGVTANSAAALGRQLATANADTLANEARSRAAQDPTAAAQLALAAWRSDPGHPQARAALLHSFVGLRGVERELAVADKPITSLRVAGDTAVATTDSTTIVVTGLSGPQPQQRVLPSDRQQTLSPDGRWMALRTEESRAYMLQDLWSHQPAIPLPAAPGTKAALAQFAPDGRLVWAEMDGAQRIRLRIWDLRSNTEIPNGVVDLPPGTDDGTLGFALVPGMDRVIVTMERSPDHGGIRHEVRALADGAEIATLPADGHRVLDGTAVATCDDSVRPTVVTVAPLNGSAPRRIEAAGYNSCGFDVTFSGNRNYLINQQHVEDPIWQVIDLRTGEAREVTLPPGVQTRGDMVQDHDRYQAQTLDVTADGKIVAAVGTSLLWLRQEPPRPATLRESDDGSVVSIEDGYYFFQPFQGPLATIDTVTGRRLGELPADWVRADWNREHLWSVRSGTDGLVLARYGLPHLHPDLAIPLPRREGDTPGKVNRPKATMSWERSREGSIIVFGDGVLSAWDQATGQARGPAIDLGLPTARELRDSPRISLRPGHPGQVAVLREDDVQIWDTTTGHLISTIPVGASLDRLWEADGRGPLALDPTGERLAVLTTDRSVEVWDVDPARQAHPPIPAPTVQALLGVNRDGQLVVVRTEGTSAPADVALLDMNTGAETGVIDLHTDVREPDIIALRNNDTLRFEDLRSGWTLNLPATAQAWRDGLCAAVGRPFTPAELALLPPGTSTDPPCE